MAKKDKTNYALLAAGLTLTAWGAFTLATVSFPLALKKYGDSWHYFRHQLLFGLLPGIILGFAVFKIRLEKLKNISFLLFILNIILLALVFIPGLGAEINGARRWLKFGPFAFQPSEFLKLSFILYLSAWFANRLKSHSERSRPVKIQAFMVFLVVSAVVMLLLILQKDMSTLVIIFLIGFLIYFSSRTPWWHILVFGFSVAGIGSLLIKLEPYRLSRIMTFFNPQLDPLGKGYQLKQSLIALGSGRIFGIGEFFGAGLGLSRQKFGFLPQPMSDSIFAIIGEELGFLGSVFLIILFLTLLWQGIKSSLETKDEFKRLLGLGIVSWFCFQAFFNIAGITGILPLAGIPLPFFSYGSSHLISELIGLGLLFNISQNH